MTGRLAEPGHDDRDFRFVRNKWGTETISFRHTPTETYSEMNVGLGHVQKFGWRNQGV